MRSYYFLYSTLNRVPKLDLKKRVNKYRKNRLLTLRNLSFTATKPWIIEKPFLSTKNETCLLARFLDEGWCLKPCLLQCFCQILRIKQRPLWEHVLAPPWTLPSPKPCILQCFLMILQDTFLAYRNTENSSEARADGSRWGKSHQSWSR